MLLGWNWLCVPYLVCAVALLSVAMVAALTRGDRVLRLGTIGAAVTALPWALCSALAICTTDPALATKLLRLGNGPIALVGPSLLLVLLGVSGQLERYRWIARSAGLLGTAFLAACWSTDWVVAGVQEIPSGILYIAPGPLTAVHFSQIGVWLALGVVIARRQTTGGERRRLVLMLVGVLALGTIGATDLLIVYDIAGVYPIAWACATIAAGVATYYELRSDLLRPQGFDRPIAIELVAIVLAFAASAVLFVLLDVTAPLAMATIASVLWMVALAVTWTAERDRPVRVARERALEELVASLGDVDREATIADELAALWKQIAVELRALHRLDGEQLVDVRTNATRALDPDIAVWLVEYPELLAAVDLGTMKVGAIRPKLEALVAAAGTTLIVPLVDRGTLVGIADADHASALREDERGLVSESARAAARALTYVGLARDAARERETAREVEVAEAMRLQASASRNDELGRWAVTAEYRSAPRTTGAGWTATLLPDGRLALLVTEAQAHGVAAALATAALTGAFAAATSTPPAGDSARPPVQLDDLLTSLRASAEGVVRGGEPVGAFIAIVDGDAQLVTWASAGHPGATIVGPIADLAAFPSGSGTGQRPKAIPLGGGGDRLGASLVMATRGRTPLSHDAMLVIASSSVRGADDAAWLRAIVEQAPAGVRLAAVLVDNAKRRGTATEDLLAVVVRHRADRRSEPILAKPIG